MQQKIIFLSFAIGLRENWFAFRLVKTFKIVKWRYRRFKPGKAEKSKYVKITGVIRDPWSTYLVVYSLVKR
jgi:hypothetical protein